MTTVQTIFCDIGAVTVFLLICALTGVLITWLEVRLK